MKRILTILFALMFLCVCAVPALATGWDPIAEPVTAQDSFNLKVTKLEYNPIADVIGQSYYQPLTSEVIKGSLVRFIVSLNVPTVVDNNKHLTLAINTKNLVITKVNVSVNKGSSLSININNLSAITGFSQGSYEYMCEGYVSSNEECSVEAIITSGQKFEDNTFKISGTDYAVTYSKQSNEHSYKITTSDQTNSITFITNINNKITDIKFNSESLPYTLNLKDNDLKYLNEVFTMLGFTLDGNLGYMYKEGFESRFGNPYKEIATAVYVAAPVVPVTPSIEPPQTGDASSIFGFVMLGLALAAAGYVTYRKVKA